MIAQNIDGTRIAREMLDDVTSEVAQLAADGWAPGLAVVLVGEDPASQVYVRSKARRTIETGMRSYEYRLNAETPETDLLAFIERLNADDEVDGILIQLPLPAHINEQTVLCAIDPAKDVDGFHPLNVGRLATGSDGLVPCTPRGVMTLIRSVTTDLSGKTAVIVGRSNIVGKPLIQLLLAENCTVLVAHSRTRDVEGMTRLGDIVIAAVGRPELVRASWIKPGAIVIDIGINRLSEDRAGRKLVGDVHYDEVAGIASALTPVPGGVGPMTIACLLQNTLDAAKARRVKRDSGRLPLTI